MKLCFIGTGYVGLVSGTVLSDLGHEVVCYDKDPCKIESLNKGICPIYEPGLEEIIKRNYNIRLSFTNDLKKALENAKAVFIAVNTPEAEDGNADLSFVYQALDNITQVYKEGTIIIKSTVPPKTCSKVKEYLSKFNVNLNVISNPEFLKEGHAIKDFIAPERIVIGAENEDSKNIANEIYKPLINRGHKILLTDTTTAEMIKYASNSFLAIKVGFINEISNLCEIVGANVEDLSYGIGLDSRIGEKFLKVGPGFGGSCFPKDIMALSYLAENYGDPLLLVKTVIQSNNARIERMVQKILNVFGGSIKGRTLSALGLAYKAKTDDVRSSPAIAILKRLKELGASIKAFDPKAMQKAESVLPEVKYCHSIEDAIKDTECIVILTEWEEFKNFDYEYYKDTVKGKVIIDLRNILNKNSLNSYKYISLGRS